MDTLRYKVGEFIIIFILMPIGFTFHFPLWVKLLIGFLGFIYIIYLLLKQERVVVKIAKNLNWVHFWRSALIKFIVILVITTGYVWYTNAEALFYVLVNNPKLWFVILFIYSVFSVYPQELVYRTFFFKRYTVFFKNKNLLLFVNALIFSLGHIFFKNVLVLGLTFIGGLLFAYTFYTTKSTLLVSIEHAIYGCWLFTVGMGDMLGFPN